MGRRNSLFPSVQDGGEGPFLLSARIIKTDLFYFFPRLAHPREKESNVKIALLFFYFGCWCRRSRAFPSSLIAGGGDRGGCFFLFSANRGPFFLGGFSSFGFEGCMAGSSIFFFLFLGQEGFEGGPLFRLPPFYRSRSGARRKESHNGCFPLSPPLPSLWVYGDLRRPSFFSSPSCTVELIACVPETTAAS